MKNKNLYYLALFSLLGIALSGYFMLQQNINPSLDVMKFYNGKDAVQFLQSLTAEEAHRYYLKEWFDFGFMASYSLLFYLLLLRLYPAQKWVPLGWLPGIFDVVENVAILSLLTSGQFERPLDWLGVVSTVKWLLAYAVMACIVIGIIKELKKRL